MRPSMFFQQIFNKHPPGTSITLVTEEQQTFTVVNKVNKVLDPLALKIKQNDEQETIKTSYQQDNKMTNKLKQI